MSCTSSANYCSTRSASLWVGVGLMFTIKFWGLIVNEQLVIPPKRVPGIAGTTGNAPPVACWDWCLYFANYMLQAVHLKQIHVRTLVSSLPDSRASVPEVNMFETACCCSWEGLSYNLRASSERCPVRENMWEMPVALNEWLVFFSLIPASAHVTHHCA